MEATRGQPLPTTAITAMILHSFFQVVTSGGNDCVDLEFKKVAYEFLLETFTLLIYYLQLGAKAIRGFA